MTEAHQLSDDDIYLFAEGTHCAIQDKLGAHLVTEGGVAGAQFAVWAPDAKAVSVVADFNHWTPGEHALSPVASSGIWCGFVAGATEGQRYKFHIESRVDGYVVDKADPVGFHHEEAPRTASVLSRLDYDWEDANWMRGRGARFAREAPVSIYEVHLGSWRRGSKGEMLSYRDIAPMLAQYAVDMHFTHVELMPVTEHPFYGSWGYQVTGQYAATSRYGSPQDLMYLIDTLHQAGVGVILDWVPAHFPTDEHGLGFFDGTHLYEHSDPRQGFHPDWTSFIYNYGRPEVRSFLISSAMFWLERYHADGLRVDGVASMLYLDYSRKDGEWIPNEDGSNENREAVAFLQQLNETFYARHPDAQILAEESTAWPNVSRPVSGGGLGFGYKWDMGWMHDTLEYLEHDPIHRSHHHNKVTFRAVYAYSENYVLPLSHDEVVHGKGSLLTKMPGDEWQKRANLRLLYGNMFAQPGKKLLFMGCEFGENREWDHDSSLDWHLLDDPRHAGIQRWVRDLNRTYRLHPALHDRDVEAGGFEWLAADDQGSSVLCFIRWGEGSAPPVVCVFNFTPVVRDSYRVGLPFGGEWRELLNSDAEIYGGSNRGNLGLLTSTSTPWHGRESSIEMVLPPLACVFLTPAVGNSQ